MKKLITLILILVISSFIVVSKDDTSLEQRIGTGKSNNSSIENKSWEYVKDRLFDGQTENVYKLKGPILIDLEGASKQDSLIVNQMMKELRIVIPNKTIDYFNNFTGIPFENGSSSDFNKSYKGISLHDLKKSTISMLFERDPNLDINIESQRDINYRLRNEIGNISRTRSVNYLSNNLASYTIFFDINKVISYSERKTYIQYEFLRSLCFIRDDKTISEDFSAHNIFNSAIHNPENSKFTDVDKFLLQKLYSDDFIEQFKTYMYANYSWRYAGSFVNKKEHFFKAISVIIGLAILVVILMFSYFQNKKYKYAYLNYFVPTFLIFLHFINLYNVYEYLFRFNSFVGWNSHIFFQVPLAVVLSVLISFLLWNSERISIKGNESFSYQFVLKVSYTFISFIFPIVLLVVFKPEVSGHFESLFPYLLLVIGLAIGRGLLLYLNHFSESLVKEKDVELSRLREAKSEAEVKMLQSQINPHFLYNALNSIASLAHTDADKTEKMTLSLSDLFRHSINRKAEKINSLQDEVNLLRSYLEIEQIRFGDRLEFTIDVEPDLLGIKIPMFILQPLVENAIKHGVSKIEGQGKIILKVNKKDNGVLISVQDNGPDFPEGLLSGHGLQTVYDLLRFSYGDKAAISWHNQPQKEIIIFIADI